MTVGDAQPRRRGHRGAVAGPHLVLYDGECGLCSRVVQFVLRHDRAGAFHFARLQSPIGRATVMRAGGDPDALTTLFVVPGYQRGGAPVLTKSDAAAYIAARLGGGWRGLSWLRVLPRRLRDGAYDLVARHRHRAFGPDEHCLVPSPEVRHRFVEKEPS